MFPDLTRDDVFRIETKRLWLRWPRAADAGAIVRLAAGERAVAEATMRVPHPIDPLGIDAFLIAARAGNSEGAGLVMAVALHAAPAALIGLVSVAPDATTAGPHLGYWLGQPFWGKGLMSEAASALVDAYFGYAGGMVLTSAALPCNGASCRVLEKCGFRREGSGHRAFPAHGGERPVHLFRQDRTAWLARAGREFGMGSQGMASDGMLSKDAT